MIILENIEKTYCNNGMETKVLRGIDLSIADGEFLCIYGRSGSGKSTLLNILGLLDDETSGKYILDGIQVQTMNEKEKAIIRNEKMGFVFQKYHLISEFTALENMVVPLGYAGIKKRDREKRARELLGRFNLEYLEKKYPSQMSGGEQQRIAIMRAIINKPQIILADEPTGNLDKENALMVMDALRYLNQQGRTIIMVTHDTKLAEYGTRIIYIEDGKVII